MPNPLRSPLARACVGLVLALLASCSRVVSHPVSGETKMLVLAYDSTAQRYRLVVGKVTTLKDLRTMQGDAASIIGGAELEVDYEALAKANPANADEIRKLTLKDEGAPVDFAWYEVDGIVHPEDFHSLNIATTYYNFEKAHLFFANLGAPLYELPVLYFPTMREGTAGALEELHDNAFWDPVVRTFAVLPFQDVRELPMGMNLGVVAHEFTHAVFSARVFPGEGVPWIYARYFAEPDKWSPALNANRSINEGLADFFGATIANDPAFLRKSLSVFAEARRLDAARPKCMNRDLEESLQSMPHAQYDPYPVGSVLAGALWDAVAQAPDRREAFARGLLDAMTKLGERAREKEDKLLLSEALDALAQGFIADLKPGACGILLDRFRMSPTDIPTCAESTAPEKRCGV